MLSLVFMSSLMATENTFIDLCLFYRASPLNLVELINESLESTLSDKSLLYRQSDIEDIGSFCSLF